MSRSDYRPFETGDEYKRRQRRAKPLPAIAVPDTGASLDREAVAAIRKWVAGRRSQVWSGPASMTAENGYDAAVEEVEAMLP